MSFALCEETARLFTGKPFLRHDTEWSLGLYRCSLGGLTVPRETLADEGMKFVPWRFSDVKVASHA